MTFGKFLAAAALGTALIASGTAIAGPKHCPPGHAKKGWCTPSRAVAPPYRWHRGDHVSRTRYRIIENYYDYGWRRPRPDQYYVVVDGRYLRI